MAKQIPYTQLTLKLFRSLGYEADVAEKWIAMAGGGGVRRDLFGCLDILALHPEAQRVIGIQSTSDGQLSPHFAKIRQEPRAGLWLQCGQELLVVGWKRTTPRKKDGSPGKAMRWGQRVFRFTPESWSGTGRPEEIPFGARK
jgi:hypothetical protein